VEFMFWLTVLLVAPGTAISRPTLTSSLEKPPWSVAELPSVYCTPAAMSGMLVNSTAASVVRQIINTHLQQCC
jgi:hypothetical protein